MPENKAITWKNRWRMKLFYDQRDDMLVYVSLISCIIILVLDGLDAKEGAGNEYEK